MIISADCSGEQNRNLTPYLSDIVSMAFCNLSPCTHLAEYAVRGFIHVWTCDTWQIPSSFSTRMINWHPADFADLHSLMNRLCSDPHMFPAISSILRFVSIDTLGVGA